MRDNTLTTVTGCYDRVERGPATLPPAVGPSVSVYYGTDPLHMLNSTRTHQPQPFASLHHLCPPEPWFRQQ